MRKYLPLFVYPPLVVLLDQVTKLWVEKNIPIQQAIPVLPGYFDLVHFRNRGVAFSFLDQLSQAGHQWFFYAVAAVAGYALIALYRRTAANDRKMQVPLALILGGAVGNLIDRIRLGEVIDFLYFHWQHAVADFDLLGRHFRFPLAWPAFNVADSAITCGALYLALKVLFLDSRDDAKK
jgi:signal peptidase II